MLPTSPRLVSPPPPEPRRRHLTPDGAIEHSSIEEFLACEIRPGPHEIHRGLPIDLLVEDRGASTTLIALHAAAPTHVTTLPMLSGRALAAATDVNLLAIADPSLVMHPDVSLGWYLGNRPQGRFRTLATPIIAHVLEQLGSTRTVFFGASGGGFAAGELSQDFPESLALLCNPRLDFTAHPRAAIRDYLVHCHSAVSRTPQLRIRDEFVPAALDVGWNCGPANTVAIIQNTGDRLYHDHQFLPFVQRHAEDPSVLHLLRDGGEGHRHVPRAELEQVIAGVAEADGIIAALRDLDFRTGVPGTSDTSQ